MNQINKSVPDKTLNTECVRVSKKAFELSITCYSTTNILKHIYKFTKFKPIS